jgi:FAD/FMN-containing dehydrogenase
VVRGHIEAVRDSIASDLTGGIYLNYAEGDDRRFGAVEGLGTDGARRLAKVKTEVDPHNLFDHGVSGVA